MSGKLKNNAITLLIRLAVNFFIGTIITLFTFRTGHDSFADIYILCLVMTNSVSLSAFFCGYMFRFIVYPIFTKKRYSVYFLIIMLASIAGVFIGIFITNIILPGKIIYSEKIIWELVIPSLLIAVVFVVYMTMIGRSKEKQRALETVLQRYKNDSANIQRGSISVKEDDIFIKIDYKDIVYLSSNGRISILHTVGRDYQVNQLLGDMADSLPAEMFMRIHKQFIVNKSFIKGIRYFEGGRYNLYLSDDDENVLPIGKAYTPDVKKMMNL